MGETPIPPLNADSMSAIDIGFRAAVGRLVPRVRLGLWMQERLLDARRELDRGEGGFVDLDGEFLPELVLQRVLAHAHLLLDEQHPDRTIGLCEGAAMGWRDR